jgi:CHAD domain-containing protein
MQVKPVCGLYCFFVSYRIALLRSPIDMERAATQLREAIGKSEIARLESTPDCGTVFQQIAQRCIEAIGPNYAQAASGDPNAIHAMRIALTRLRAARLFFWPIVKGAASPDIERQLRWLNSALGRARNRDVAIQYADRKRYRRWAKNSRQKMLRSQDKAHRRLAKALTSARYTRLASALNQWIVNDPSLHRGQTPRSHETAIYCDERLREWRSEISRKGRYIGTLGRNALHRLRIQSKHYRYMVEALLELDVPVSREDFVFCETAKQVHRGLGDLRDLRRLRKYVGRRPPHYRRRKRKLIQQAARSFRRPP